MVKFRTAVSVALVVSLSVCLISLATITSLYLVIGLRAGLLLFIQFLTFISELLVSLVAAVTSGATITLMLLVAVWASRITFPPHSIQARMGVTTAIAAVSMLVSGIIVVVTAALQVEFEVAAGILSAAAGAVAFASAWAVGVMSLIERETQQAGLKMQSLLDAVRHNNHFLLRLILRIQTEIRQKDLDRALLQAVRAGYSQCTQILVATGADVEARDSFENTSLMLACESGHVELCEILVKHQANVHARNKADATALHQASRWGHIGCVQCLLDNCANPNALDSNRRIPLLLAIEATQHADDVMRLLIAAGSDVSLAAYGNTRGVHIAAAKGVGMDLLLESGADPDCENLDGDTPLLIACYRGNYKVLQTLLGRGAAVAQRNKKYRNCVHFCAMKGSFDCLKLVLEHGADPFTVDCQGHSPLWYAMSSSHVNVSVHLLKLNCHMFSTTPGQIVISEAALNLALEKGESQIIKALALVGCHHEKIREWVENPPVAKWTDGNLEVILWLRQFLRTPQPMAHQCRLVIRRVLAQRLHRSYRLLPLPSCLQNFIMFDEIL